MSTGYCTPLRSLAEWDFGSMWLMCVEANPRSGPPEFCFAAESSGETWICPLPPEQIAGWHPHPHEKTKFFLLLMDTTEDGGIVLDAEYRTVEGLMQRAERIRSMLTRLCLPQDTADREG